MAPGQLRSRTAGARWSRSAAPSSSAAPHLLTEGPLAAPRSRSAPPQPQPPRGQGCARCPFARLAARAPALAPAQRPAVRAGRRARARPAARRSSAGDGQRLAPRAPARPGARCGSARAPHVLASCAANLAEWLATWRTAAVVGEGPQAPEQVLVLGRVQALVHGAGRATQRYPTLEGQQQASSRPCFPA